ncbi:hypothetical protein [Jeotgalibacillus soli]|uniref:hypothetical protein n=1 Tax=Jeotgalibacillus soli TaxID=889306 RepID=UPI000597995A|nr:hypothetical protein [Jeotgalibacillus soli]
MILIIEYKDQEIPLVVSSSPKEVLQAIVDSKDNTLVYNNNSTLNINQKFDKIKSITITFE